MVQKDFRSKELNPREVFAFVKYKGAPTTLEVKTHFSTDSASVRVAMGKLMRVNKVMPVPYGRAITYMIVDGNKGTPSPKKRREEAPGYEDVEKTPTQKKADKFIQEEMTKSPSSDKSSMTFKPAAAVNLRHDQ